MDDRVFYSQFGEDELLDRIFLQKRNGVCIEVGANDGITDSTTYHFEKKGWSCILIEPNPELCARIRQSRNALLIECAASNQEGNATLYVAEGAERAHGVSTICEEAQERIHRFGFSTKPVQVRRATLDGILRKANIASYVDFVSIDVEGHELDVLKGFSIEMWRPRIIIAEDNSNFANTEVTNYLKQQNYLPFMRTGVNDWYAHKSDKALVNFGNRMRYACKAFLKNSKKRMFW